jgi:hypothetical protein
MITTAYQLEFDEFKSIDVQLVMMRGTNGITRWAIQERGYVFGVDGEWVYELKPSSRDDEYYRRYRFSSVKEALKMWFAHKGRSDFLSEGEEVAYRLQKSDVPKEFR